MKLRIASIAMLVALIGAFAIAPLSADAKKGGAYPITATATGDEGSFSITGELNSFTNQGGTLLVNGVLEIDGDTYDFTSEVSYVEVGESTSASTNGVQLLAAQQASCGILYLEINEIFLDLLGLQIAIDPIVIDVSAVPGAGNLLGNLLCAVAGILDGGGPLGSIAGLLNNLLRNLLGALSA